MQTRSKTIVVSGSVRPLRLLLSQENPEVAEVVSGGARLDGVAQRFEKAVRVASAKEIYGGAPAPQDSTP